MNDFLRIKLLEMEERIAEIVSFFEAAGTPLLEQQADMATEVTPLAAEAGRLVRAAFVLLSTTPHEPSRKRRLWDQLESLAREYERVTGMAIPDGALPDAEEARRLEEESAPTQAGVTAGSQTVSDGSGGLVFLCHSSGDKPYVRRLERRLKGDGIRTWLDESNLLPGQDWDHEIRKAVRHAAAVVVCLSHGAVSKSGYLQKEIRFVLDVADEQPPGTIFVIPARLEDCDVPERLRVWHWVDLFRRGGYHRLRAAIEEVSRTKSA
jgi:TIR domain